MNKQTRTFYVATDGNDQWSGARPLPNSAGTNYLSEPLRLSGGDSALASCVRLQIMAKANAYAHKSRHDSLTSPEAADVYGFEGAPRAIIRAILCPMLVQ